MFIIKKGSCARIYHLLLADYGERYLHIGIYNSYRKYIYFYKKKYYNKI